MSWLIVSNDAFPVLMGFLHGPASEGEYGIHGVGLVV